MSEPIEQTLATALDGLGARIRVHEIARRTGLTSKEVLALLRESGVELPSAQSSVDADVATTTITRILAPAGSAPVAEPEVAEPEVIEPENSLFQEPAAPPARRSRARKPKAAEPAEPAPVEVEPIAADPVPAEEPAAPVKAPRTRSRKPKAAPVVDADPAVEEPAAPIADEGADAPVAPPRTRSRRSRKPAVEEVVETEVDAVEVAAEVPTADEADGVVTIGAGDDNADWEPEAEDEGQSGRRRRGRGSRRGRGRADQDQNDTSDAEAPAPDGATAPLFVAPAEAEPVTRTQDDIDGAEGDAADGDAADGDDDADGQSRRRRRRGRRGRGRVADNETENDTDDTDAPAGGSGSGDEAAADTDGESADGESAEADEAEGEGGDRRRRRRRRRRGGSGPEEGRTDDPDNTVVHVRETRPATSSSSEEVQGVRGSTRLEAKRQRRRDTRESRKRPQILSEAEFLARREAVDRVMAVRQRGDLAQVALLEDGVLVEHFVSRDGAESLMGNIYLGRVQNVLPSMEAAFVDIGRGRNAVLYAGEVNWSAAGLAGKARRIETALSSGDTVLVQVSKDPVGHKGARLTTQISLPGRFLVYVPGGGATGISRKLPDTERKRLKAILDRIVPSDAGVIIRTAAEGVPEEELAGDVERLKAAWEDIQRRSEQKQSAPAQLSAEPDTLIKVVRDLFNSDIDKLVLDGPDIQDKVADYVAAVAPELSERVEKFDASSGHDVFHRYRIDDQISKALARKVHLPSGGSLVIDRTEAMTVVDVNTGKYTGSGGNLEETVTRNNLEAAEEIVRQLRLRDIGGIIVVDFIDMVLESNRELVLRRLTEALGRDRSRHQVAEVTSLGLVQMTRKRMGTGLVEAFSEPCSHCGGRGLVLHDVPVDGSGGPDEDNGGRRRRKGNDRPQAKPEPLLEAPRVVVPTTRKPDPRGPKPPTPNGHAAAPEPTPVVTQTPDDAAAEAAAAVAALVAAEVAVTEQVEPAPADDVSAVLAALDALPAAEPAQRRRGRRAAGRAAGPAGAAMPIVLPEVSAALDAVIERIEPVPDAPAAAVENAVEATAVDEAPAPSNGEAGDGAAPAARPRRRRAARRPAGPAQG